MRRQRRQLTVALAGGTEFNFVNDVPHFDTYISPPARHREPRSMAAPAARAAIGHAAAPLSRKKNSRRRIIFPGAQDRTFRRLTRDHQNRKLGPTKRGAMISVRRERSGAANVRIGSKTPQSDRNRPRPSFRTRLEPDMRVRHPFPWGSIRSASSIGTQRSNANASISVVTSGIRCATPKVSNTSLTISLVLTRTSLPPRRDRVVLVVRRDRTPVEPMNVTPDISMTMFFCRL
jgi:hypothetical protein